ncbi:MAG: OmpA family protein [Ignavibacteriaceae bacterium]|nr:OmpA family protein [Ignavibacteriaceae bacterium]HRN26404.1 OmpA family protein [Ignavibacteriaceae bacterium]HRP93861.1 OmpA family protein [Ignavibacteriaceae bacterium]HRQ54037.1 OmpA family protein [Ignavibacteriaceae bacterium]
MKTFAFAIVIFLICRFSASADFGDPIINVKDKAQEKVEKKIDDAMDKSANKNESLVSENKTDVENTSKDSMSTKSYQNYDFVPGDKIIFEDNFADDVSGEFPSHWNLISGQAQVNNFRGENIFALTEGNYASVIPLMKTDTYLVSDTFTVEFDFYTQPGAYNKVGIQFWNPQNEEQRNSITDEDQSSVFVGYDCTNKDLLGRYPEDQESFENNKWHHVAIARKGRQLKIYEDQYRILNIPVFKGETYAVNFVGIGDPDKPIMIRNVRIAQGGDFNDTKRIVQESRIIVHGILFDTDKATLKPESMGSINQIYNVMKDNPQIKYEIDGYTDNTGNAKHNLELSQNRADAVKTQLVNMGIDSSRLTTKGYGDTKPISDNSTPEGRANNRRVEFIRI